MQTMKRISILLFVTLLGAAGCDIKPAEEVIADTGALNFTASFEIGAGMSALWNAGDKVLVVDSDNGLHKFDLDDGASRSEGEFSGTLSSGAKVKYVAYAHDCDEIEYDADTEEFSMVVPSIYNSKASGSLVTANNAAIGTLQGSEVSLQSVCGFIKFTLEDNGKTLEQGGMTYNLTDIREVKIVSNDGKAFAGTVHARWPEGAAAPVFTGIEDGSTTISFRTRSISTPEGNLYYEAGDYYIPVAPQNYEDVTILVVNEDGKEATSVKSRAIDVQTAVMSNLNTVTWPTIVLEVNLKCGTKKEEQTHLELTTFPSSGLAVDRVNKTTGVKFDGQTPKKTELFFRENRDLVEGGIEYSLWTTGGVGRWTSSVPDGYAMQDLCFCFYSDDWTYSNEKWIAGTQHEVSWIKFPAYNGILSRVEINLYSFSYGPISISSEVDPETGLGNNDMYYSATTTRPFHWENIPIIDAKANTPYYFVMGDGHYYRVQGWKLHYKIFD